MQITHNKQGRCAPFMDGGFCNWKNYGYFIGVLPQFLTHGAVSLSYFSKGHDSNVESQPIFPIPIAGLIYHLLEVCSRFIAVRHLRTRPCRDDGRARPSFFATTTRPSIVGHSGALISSQYPPSGEASTHAGNQMCRMGARAQFVTGDMGRQAGRQ